MSHISGMGQVSLYGHEQLIVSTVDQDVPQEEVVGQLTSTGHHSVKIENQEVTSNLNIFCALSTIVLS